MIFKSINKSIFNSNKKLKVKSQKQVSNPHHSVDQFRYKSSVTLYPLCHSAHVHFVTILMRNVFERVKFNPTWTFIIRKMLYEKRFYHRVGLDSRIFRTKHFEQKYVLTGFIIILLQWRLCPFKTKISFEISLYFVHFLRILHVYDFLSMFYLTHLREPSVRFARSHERIGHLASEDVFN